MLLRRVQTLRALSARAPEGELLARGDVLVTVDEHLAQDLVSVGAADRRDVGSGYHVRIESAIARFEDGLALVRFDGRASAAGSSSFAELSLFAGVDRVLLEPGAGELRARLTVFAVDAPKVQLRGRRAAVSGVVSALGPSGLEALATLLPAIPIPLALNTTVELPEVRSSVVRIAPAQLPLAFTVRDVAVFRGRIWVSLGAASGDAAAAATPPEQLQALLRAGDATAAVDAPTIFGLAARGCTGLRRRERAVAEAQAGLERAHDEEARRFARRLARDGLVQEALADPSEVAVVLRQAFVEGLVRHAAATYLRSIEVDLRSKVVRKSGEERRATPLGRRRVGSWNARVRLDGVRGTAHVGEPVVRLGRGNTVALSLPVSVPATPASVSVAFAWRSAGVGKLVCRDFDLEHRVEGRLPPLRATLSGGFVLSAEGEALVAQPFFENRTLHLAPELSAEGWAAVRAAVATQDTLLRCGIGLDPDAAVARLRELLARGFDVPLPPELFAPVRLPARFSPSVSVGTREVRLAVRATGALVTDYGLWARARMHAAPASGSAPVSD